METIMAKHKYMKMITMIMIVIFLIKMMTIIIIFIIMMIMFQVTWSNPAHRMTGAVLVLVDMSATFLVSVCLFVCLNIKGGLPEKKVAKLRNQKVRNKKLFFLAILLNICVVNKIKKKEQKILFLTILGFYPEHLHCYWDSEEEKKDKKLNHAHLQCEITTNK